MIGPILRLELLLGSRRTRLHYLRWGIAAWLLILVIALYFRCNLERNERSQALDEPRHNRVAHSFVVARWFASAFLDQQLLLLLLATPVFVAGAVTDEKRSATLDALLTTPLESRHLILG